jgi:shikimate dehydrogenase
VLAAVIGSPVSHSLSPVLHTAAYRELGLPHDYRAIEVNKDGFADFMKTVNSFWLGLSLTMPLKEIAFSVAHEVTPVALLARSINTLLVGEKLVADNTDVIGIVRAIEESAVGPFRTMVLIGSGATARSAIVAAGQLGVRQVWAVARNQRALHECEKIAKKVGVGFADMGIRDILWDSETVTINTTPKGVADGLLSSMPGPRGALLDVVYHPWPTQIARYWQEFGQVAIPGHTMLLHQAAKQVELMTGHQAPVEVMRQALIEALNNR